VWSELSGVQRAFVVAATGLISEANLEAHLSSPGLYDAMTGARRDVLEFLLDAPCTTPMNHEAWADLDPRGLLVAAASEGWSPSRALALWESAMGEHVGPGGVLPSSGLCGADAWISYARRTRQ
jgi:hypothetical protein